MIRLGHRVRRDPQKEIGFSIARQLHRELTQAVWEALSTGQTEKLTKQIEATNAYLDATPPRFFKEFRAIITGEKLR